MLNNDNASLFQDKYYKQFTRQKSNSDYSNERRHKNRIISNTNRANKRTQNFSQYRGSSLFGTGNIFWKLLLRNTYIFIQWNSRIFVSQHSFCDSLLNYTFLRKKSILFSQISTLISLQCNLLEIISRSIIVIKFKNQADLYFRRHLEKLFVRRRRKSSSGCNRNKWNKESCKWT